jgi:hypothetical protein
MDHKPTTKMFERSKTVKLPLFRFVVLPSSTYLFTVGVEVFFFLISVGHARTHTTVGRTPPDEGSARRRDLYLRTQTLYKRQTSMPPGGIRTRDPTKRSATDLRLRPRGHWDRRNRHCNSINYTYYHFVYFYDRTAQWGPKSRFISLIYLCQDSHISLLPTTDQ